MRQDTWKGSEENCFKYGGNNEIKLNGQQLIKQLVTFNRNLVFQLQMHIIDRQNYPEAVLKFNKVHN